MSPLRFPASDRFVQFVSIARQGISREPPFRTKQKLFKMRRQAPSRRSLLQSRLLRQEIASPILSTLQRSEPPRGVRGILSEPHSRFRLTARMAPFVYAAYIDIAFMPWARLQVNRIKPYRP
jgi:hypothetical protein